VSRRILLIAGTRPEVIKLAPLYLELQSRDETVAFFLSTGQHREMVDQALSVFRIQPDFDLRVMQSGQDLTSLTVRVLEGVGRYLDEVKPDAVIVQGDTTTVFASAIAAFYRKIPIGHVEAGLRTYNLEAPWPEEMNRRLVDPISHWCFAPTPLSRDHILQEQIPSERVFVTGNTVIDALLWTRAKINRQKWVSEQVAMQCKVPRTFSEPFFGNGHPWVLVTGHRRESFGRGFEDLCHALRLIVEQHPEVGILYPVHLNPQVQEPVHRILGGIRQVALIKPVNYETFVWMMDHCRFVISDSGGVQEEAPSLGKPVLVTRDTSERPEGVSAGTCVLVGTKPDKILHEAALLLKDQDIYRSRSALKNPYGDGTASKQIVDIISNWNGNGWL
jgi:UDP-N-acetylglucosamine 2-epimerase (non-hydrolysing)